MTYARNVAWAKLKHFTVFTRLVEHPIFIVCIHKAGKVPQLTKLYSSVMYIEVTFDLKVAVAHQLRVLVTRRSGEEVASITLSLIYTGKCSLTRGPQRSTIVYSESPMYCVIETTAVCKNHGCLLHLWRCVERHIVYMGNMRQTVFPRSPRAGWAIIPALSHMLATYKYYKSPANPFCST